VIDTPIVANSPDSTVRILANNVALGKADDPNGFKLQGKLDVGNKTATLKSASEAELGGLTTISGGTIQAPKGVQIKGGATLKGSGTVNAPINAKPGSTIEADGALALGDDSSDSGVSIDGDLDAKQFEVTLKGNSDAMLGGNVKIAGGAVKAPKGIVVND